MGSNEAISAFFPANLSPWISAAPYFRYFAIICYPFSGIFIHVYVLLDDILLQKRLGNLTMAKVYLKELHLPLSPYIALLKYGHFQLIVGWPFSLLRLHSMQQAFALQPLAWCFFAPQL